MLLLLTGVTREATMNATTSSAKPLDRREAGRLNHALQNSIGCGSSVEAPGTRNCGSGNRRTMPIRDRLPRKATTVAIGAMMPHQPFSRVERCDSLYIASPQRRQSSPSSVPQRQTMTSPVTVWNFTRTAGAYPQSEQGSASTLSLPSGAFAPASGGGGGDVEFSSAVGCGPPRKTA